MNALAELVKRLRFTPLYYGHGDASSLGEEAADALEAETARIAKLEAALRSVIDAADSFKDDDGYSVASQVKLRARAALGKDRAG